MHYYKFNIGDYSSHTQHLDEMEDLAYRRMIDWCYLHESPLPDSVDQIARLIRMRTHSESITNVLQEFFTLGEYGWFQSKIEKELAQYKAKSEKARASSLARWNKPDANALQAQSECNANHKPLTNNQEPIVNSETGVSPKPKKPAKQKFNFKKALVEIGVEQGKIDHWLQVRKDKKASNTRQALLNIRAEAKKAGIDLKTAIEFASDNDWKGFKADWYRNAFKGSGFNGTASKGQQQATDSDLMNYINDGSVGGGDDNQDDLDDSDLIGVDE